VRTRLLFILVVTPLGVLGRPLWRRQLGLTIDRGAETYWRRRRDGEVSAADLRRSS
jgi:hypothetical protein